MWRVVRAVLTFPIIVFQGMVGGQGPKWIRRFLMPVTAVVLSFQNWGWKSLAYLLLIPVLCIGYGQNSVFYQWLGNDTLVRLLYGFLLAVPFITFGWKRAAIAAVALMLAFLVHTGGCWKFGMEWLLDDFIRYGVLALLIIINNLTGPKK